MTTTHNPSDARMTAQAPYESLRAELLNLARECDGIEGLGSGVIAHRIRCIVVDHEAALPERAPVSAGGDADKGPWHVGANGRDVFSDDFTVDAALRIEGDFEDDDHRRRYAEWLCAKLNIAPSDLVETRLPEGVTAMACPTCGEHIQYREEATPAPPVGAWDRRGGTIYLDREEAGIVVDALIDHRENAEQRKGKNFASSSDYRANKCAELIGRLNTESAAPTPAEARGVGDGDAVKMLRQLYLAYVRTLEAGRDRITSLGGQCDPVDVMEHADPDLIQVRQFLADTRQAQAQGSEDLASWLRWVAGELVKRDTQGGTFAQGVAQSLCGRAYILEYVAHKKDAAHAQAGEGSNG